MSTYYQIKPGDNLVAIAAKNGFTDYHALWDNPKNAQLKSKRKFPGVLFPGDILFIPDKQDKQLARGTTQTHQFVVRQPSVTLTVVLHTVDRRWAESGSPVDSAPSRLLQGNKVTNKTTDGSGKVQFDISTEASGAPAIVTDSAKVTEQPWRLPMVISELYDLELEPFDANAAKASLQKHAWRDRLNNLGYFAGYEDKDEEHFRWAMEEFQCDHVYPGNPDQITGKCDAKSKDKMQTVYGC